MALLALASAARLFMAWPGWCGALALPKSRALLLEVVASAALLVELRRRRGWSR